MRLYEIEKNPTLAFNYLERQVNDGSKSGFTNIHTTSLQTNPFYSDGYYIMKGSDRPQNVIVWRGPKGDNTHCTTNLNMKEWATAKS